MLINDMLTLTMLGDVRQHTGHAGQQQYARAIPQTRLKAKQRGIVVTPRHSPSLHPLPDPVRPGNGWTDLDGTHLAALAIPLSLHLRWLLVLIALSTYLTGTDSPIPALLDRLPAAAGRDSAGLPADRCGRPGVYLDVDQPARGRAQRVLLALHAADLLP